MKTNKVSGVPVGNKLEISEIQSRIYTVRGLQVMLDRDIALFYSVETRAINQAVKRNPGRFPVDFCFQFSEDEFNNWKSQNVMSEEDRIGLRRPPYAFTEQGVAMLSAVLKSKIAVKVSVSIMNAFVGMRRFIQTNAGVFMRLDNLEQKQMQTDDKIDKILSEIESRSIRPRQGIFYDGRVFDAWKLVSDIMRSAKKSVVLIDNYVDDTVLSLFSKRAHNVSAAIYMKNISKQLKLDVEKFNQQYQPVELKEFALSHDRFLIIDEKDLYHFGASLKDMGKKWFAFSKMDIKALEVLEKIQELHKTI